MDWYLSPGGFETALGLSLGQWVVPVDHDALGAEGTAGRAHPSDVDRELVELVYGFIAHGATCGTCGAPLGRDLRVGPAPSTAVRSAWCLTVRTRCRGWRRHGHVATVTGRHDLELGPLRRR